MSQDLGVIVTGDRAVELKFDQFPQQLHGRLLTDVTGLTKRLEALVRSRAPKLTGRLQGEIVSQVYDNAERITGRVTVTGEYAKVGAEEYGAHKAFTVSSHAMRLDHAFGQRLNAPLTVMVAAYKRRPNITEQRFFRGSIDDMHGEIVQGLREGVIETEQAS